MKSPAEVRRFCAELDGAFPFWFYFLSAEGVTLQVIACCLCSVIKDEARDLSVGPDLRFMTRHFGALNWLVDTFALDERRNVEISRKVTEYFGDLSRCDRGVNAPGIGRLRATARRAGRRPTP